MMILISLLVTTGLMTLARSSPMSYATYRRREIPVDERPELLIPYDQRDPEKTDSPQRSVYDIEGDYANEIGLRDDISDLSSESAVSSLARDKKFRLGRRSLGLSIVHPMEVLRERVILELNRRKAQQNQRQIDANRRMLETIGKRSISKFNIIYPRSLESSENDDDQIYTNEVHDDNGNKARQTYTQRIPVERTHEWNDAFHTVIRENDDGETRKVHIRSNYHRDGM